VYCQITGFGRTGPLADQGGFDLIAQGYAGLMSVTGEGPGRAPVKVGAPVTDITAGILGALGVVSALFQRERTGRGSLVDTSLYEAGVTHTYWQSAIALAGGGSSGPLGSAHPLSAPYQAFRTSDGWVNVGASNEATWQRLIDALGRNDLARDPRFTTNAHRMANLDALVDVLSREFETRGTDDWLRTLEAAGVPAGPVASIGEMLEHPHTMARGMVKEVRHTTLGDVPSLGSAVKFAPVAEGDPEATDPGAAVGRGAPLLGEHTREVLVEWGWSASEVADLEDGGVVVDNRTS